MKIHFIAIGGAAMHNLAIALKKKGHCISGSDDIVFEPSRSRLAAHGILPKRAGWFPDKITSNLDKVILGMHAKADNPELLKARALDLPIYSFPQFLYEQTKHKTRIVIGGSHGKTTITSMVLHVLKNLGEEVDFMVGAQLTGFDVMVELKKNTEFIILEGDEYLSSPIDPRPKFVVYKPNIALLSGIAWDHVNVFHSKSSYERQFELYLTHITDGGVLIYNEEDKGVVKMVNNCSRSIRKIGYRTPEYKVINGQTILQTPSGELPLAIFGRHNLNNLAGAQWICQQMGVSEDDFYESISSFKGASKRLEKIKETESCVLFKDFAHSPSKVSATVKAVKEQYPDKKLMACLELHTYSSFNENYLKEYRKTLNDADLAVVFYDKSSAAVKGLKPIVVAQIKEAFQRKDLLVFKNFKAFETYLFSIDFNGKSALLMSSGNYGGIDFERLKEKI